MERPAIVTLPLPMALLRRIVRKNPWLLSTNGTVNKVATFEVGPFLFEFEQAWTLTDKVKAKLQAEADSARMG